MAKKEEERVLCETPTPGKMGTRILKWKYLLVRRAILRAVGRGRSGVEFQALPDLVADILTDEELASLGSITWYVTTVKLDLEVRGVIERVEGARPQRVRRVI